jgi:hypothetical protein
MLLIAGLVLAAGCGSDDEGTDTTATAAETVAANEVENALMTELGQGGTGIVEHDAEPKLVTCRKDTGTRSGWRCTVTSKGPETYLCTVEVDPRTKQVTKRTCARIDN